MVVVIKKTTKTQIFGAVGGEIRYFNNCIIHIYITGITIVENESSAAITRAERQTLFVHGFFTVKKNKKKKRRAETEEEAKTGRYRFWR